MPVSSTNRESRAFYGTASAYPCFFEEANSTCGDDESRRFYFEKSIEFSNLFKAMKQCCKNVRWKDSVTGYEANGLLNTYILRQELLTGSYHLRPYYIFQVHEPKERTIVATNFRDRQVQRAICNAGLYDDLTRGFLDENVACQTGKGTDFMLDNFRKQLMAYYKLHGLEGWVLKCDVKHFFPSTRHDVVKELVFNRVMDKNVQSLLFNVIDSFEGKVGIGLGSQVSQLMELGVLHPLDKTLRSCPVFIRYMDDFLVVVPTKSMAQSLKRYVGYYLEALHLSLNPKSCIYPLKQGIRLCKWRFYFTDTGKLIMKLDSSKMKRERQKLRKLLKGEVEGTIPKGSGKKSLDSFIANAKRGNTYKQIGQMIEYYYSKEKEYDLR